MAVEKNKSFPDFETPPVNEVVFGVQFETIEDFQAPHFGILWDGLGRTKYPNCQEVPLLVHTTEEDKGTRQVPFLLFKENKPLLPRVFFIDPTGRELVQVQQDRFLRNWRKINPGDTYPRYEILLPKFEESLNSFEQFISKEFKGQKLEIDQYELTYVNHINIADTELNQDKLSQYFSIYQDNKFFSFLPSPEALGWTMTYKLPNSLGRLHISLSQAYNSKGEKLFVLNLTARGISEQQDLKSWLKVAHEWIVRGFVDITSKEAQKNIWRRIDGNSY